MLSRPVLLGVVLAVATVSVIRMGQAQQAAAAPVPTLSAYTNVWADSGTALRGLPEAQRAPAPAPFVPPPPPPPPPPPSVEPQRPAAAVHQRPGPTLELHVLTYSRAKPLQRLLESLNAADYDGDTLELTIWVDKPAAGKPEPAGRAAAIETARAFPWRHGPKDVQLRERHHGLRDSWLSIYNPAPDDNTAALVLEDDLEVSPAYYRWVKKALASYAGAPHVAALSLQRPTLVPRGPPAGQRKPRFPPAAESGPFLYKLPGSWGFVAIARPWAEFLRWQREKSAIRDWVPQVPNLITSDWFMDLRAKGRADTMWTQWFIRFCDDRGLYSVYTRAPSEGTLCSNHQEAGEHFSRAQGVDFRKVPGWSAALDVFPAAAELRRYGWDGFVESAPAAVPPPAPVPAVAPAVAPPAHDHDHDHAHEGEPNIRIQVITFDRDRSLQRLLNSLAAADYEGDRVPLDIWVDAPKDPSNPPAGWERCVAAARGFTWRHGEVNVHVRERNVGLIPQWTEAWVPASDDEACLILEDDLEVSPQFYKWLKRAKAKYGGVQELLGISLQHMTLQARGGGRINIPQQHPAYTYRLLGSWGFMPLGRPWRQFQAWLREKRADPNFHPYVDGLVTTNWYKMFEKQGKTHTMWTAWAIKFSEERGLTTLFANVPGKTLCANWQEKGLHFDGSSAKRDFPLLPAGAPLPALPDTLEQFDWAGHPAGRLSVEAAAAHDGHDHGHTHSVSHTDLKASLAAVAKDNTVIVTTTNFGYVNFALNWLCSIRKLGISNYLFYATDEQALHWLQEQGEMVFHDHVGKGEAEAAVNYGTVKYQELILARTKFVKACLDLGYHVLLVDVDTYWLKDPMPYLNEKGNVDIVAQKEANGDMCGGFLLLRQTSNTRSFWDAVTANHVKIVDEAHRTGALKNMDQSEQQWMNQERKRRGDQLRVAFLDPNIFPNGQQYFERGVRDPSKVAVTHNNYVIGSANKLRRFKSKGLWKVKDGKCVA